MDRKQEVMKLIALLCAFNFAALPVHAETSFAVKLEMVIKTKDRTYDGKTGKTHLVLHTRECYHETPKSETVGFTWLGTEGTVIFENADICEVASYSKY